MRWEVITILNPHDGETFSLPILITELDTVLPFHNLDDHANGRKLFEKLGARMLDSLSMRV